MLRVEDVTAIRDAVNKILERYRRYERLIKYPGDWGERAFRFWLASEVIHGKLKWPIANIVFGERYDILLVDNEVVPKVYVETKRPGTNVTKNMLNESISRAGEYYSIEYVLLTNGTIWLLYDDIKKSTVSTSIECSDLQICQRLFNAIYAPNII